MDTWTEYFEVLGRSFFWLQKSGLFPEKFVLTIDIIYLFCFFDVEVEQETSKCYVNVIQAARIQNLILQLSQIIA